MTQISFAYENPLKLRFGEEFFKTIPTSAGVYFFLDAQGEPLYIGKADNLRRRLQSYATAKPGRAPEHTLEMIELADSLRWELSEDGARALLRESQLIRVIRPPFNIAGTDPLPFLFIGTRFLNGDEQNTGVEYRLSTRELPSEFMSFGCFPHRGKAKAGYSALLRLFFVCVCNRDRFQLPARICRSSPPYIYKAAIPKEWRRPFECFLKGESDELLRLISRRLLEKENVPPYLYAPLQRDLHTAREFFTTGPASTRQVVRVVGQKRHWISQSRMERHLAKTFKEEFLGRSPPP